MTDKLPSMWPTYLTAPVSGAPEAFDGYEVALAVETTDARGDSYTERVDDAAHLTRLRESGDALLLMFTVYGHFPSGGVAAISDAIVTSDGDPAYSYETQRAYALALARSIDAGHTVHGVDDMTFPEPEETPA